MLEIFLISRQQKEKKLRQILIQGTLQTHRLYLQTQVLAHGLVLR